MNKLHGIPDDDQENNQSKPEQNMTTPRSPTKPKGSRNVPRKDTVMASNDPLTTRPPAPKTTKVRSLVTPKFTADQHYVAQYTPAVSLEPPPSPRLLGIPVCLPILVRLLLPSLLPATPINLADVSKLRMEDLRTLRHHWSHPPYSTLLNGPIRSRRIRKDQF